MKVLTIFVFLLKTHTIHIQESYWFWYITQKCSQPIKMQHFLNFYTHEKMELWSYFFFLWALLELTNWFSFSAWFLLDIPTWPIDYYYYCYYYYYYYNNYYYFALHLTLVEIHLNDKTNCQSHSLQLRLFTPN